MLSQQQIADYESKGYLFLKNFLSDQVLERMLAALERIEEMDGPEYFRESNSDKIRTIFAPELFDDDLHSILKDQKLIQSIDQLLEEEYYLFQSKLNVKASLESGSWSWHQDFKFWREDGMLEPKALTVAIFLSDVTDFSGPIIAVPGSHKMGEIQSYLNNPDGVHDESLKYLITPETLKNVIKEFGSIVSFTGQAGDALIFHSNILHGSFQNMHFADRKLLMFTFNPVSNITEVTDPRPEYMVKQNREVLNSKK